MACSKEKLCCFCEHMDIWTDGYDTSGYYGVAGCRKYHWESSVWDRKNMLNAETCPDYKEAKP